MNPQDAFERILASLYEAALDDARWPAATALVEEAVGGFGNALIVGDGLGEDTRVYFARLLRRGDSYQDVMAEYFNAYHPHDEGMPRLRRLPHGQLVAVRDLYTEDELKTSPAYNEGMRLLGNRNGLTVRFDGPDGLRIAWGIGDPVGGDWASARLRLLEGLLPHLHRAVLIRQALAAAEALGGGLTGLQDNARIGAVHLDRGGRVVAANAPALDILRRGDGLHDRGGVLSAWLPADHVRLQELLARALPAFGGHTPSGASMTVRRPSGGMRLGLHLCPLGDAQADFGGRRVAVLALLVDPARPPRIDPLRVAEMFGLTRPEGRATALLAEGNSVREIAALADWQEGYVRWLLSRVNKKHGLSGQVDLMRRVLAAESFLRR